MRFELTVQMYTGFQNQNLKPLSHSPKAGEETRTPRSGLEDRTFTINEHPQRNLCFPGIQSLKKISFKRVEKDTFKTHQTGQKADQQLIYQEEYYY